MFGTPNEQLQMQSPIQQEQQPIEQIRQPVQQEQQPFEQMSETELLLRQMEETAGVQKSETDVARVQDRQHGIKSDKRSFLHWLTGGKFGKRNVARLTREERRETRSDARRMDVKARLGVIAGNFAQDKDVKKNEKLLDIVTKIRAYSELDTTAVKKTADLEQESDVYQQICAELQEYIGGAYFGNNVKLANIASRLHTFFALQQEGNMRIPSAETDVVIEDNLRAPMRTKKIDGKVYEDYSSRGEIVEKRLEKERPLFPHEPCLSDIQQNQLGDCYFLAALSSIVNQDPQTIKDCMRDDGAGHVYVRFYKKEADDKFSPVYVRTEKIIPQAKDGSDIFAGGALWVQMMERAYANVRRQFAGEDRFGRTGEQMQPKELQMRRNMHEAIRLALQNSSNPDLPVASREAVLNEFRYDPLAACMFDENGQFIEDFAQVPTGMMRASYADIASGFSSEAFEAIMGKPASLIWLDVKNKAWVTIGFDQILKNLHENAGAGEQDPQTTDQDFLIQSVVNAVKNDSLFIRKNAEEQSEDWKLDGMSQELETFLQNLRIGSLSSMEKGVARSLKKDRDSIRKILEEELKIPFMSFMPRPEQTAKNAKELAYQKLYELLKPVIAGIEDSYPHPEIGKYSKEADDVYKMIQDAAAKKQLMTASTRDFGVKNQVGINGEPVSDGVVGMHAFTVLGVEEREVSLGDGPPITYKFVKLRNPWGQAATQYVVEDGKMHTEAGEYGEKGKQGIFLMELQDFTKYYEKFYIL